MSGARVALSSIPGRGISLDGVVAIFPRDTLILRANVCPGKTVLKGQAVMFSVASGDPLVALKPNSVECSVDADTRIFAGVAESSGTLDLATFNASIPVVSVVRGPAARGVIGGDPAAMAAVRYVKAGADGKFYPADLATGHAVIRDLPTVTSFDGLDSKCIDVEFWTIGK